MFPTLVDFESWLKTLPGSRTFRRGDDCECPLAKYLNMKVENAFAFVETIDGEHKVTYPLPPWAKALVWEVDTTPGTIPISVKYLLSVILPKVRARITEPFTQKGPSTLEQEVDLLNKVHERLDKEYKLTKKGPQS